MVIGGCHPGHKGIKVLLKAAFLALFLFKKLKQFNL